MLAEAEEHEQLLASGAASGGAGFDAAKKERVQETTDQALEARWNDVAEFRKYHWSKDGDHSDAKDSHKQYTNMVFDGVKEKRPNTTDRGF